MKNNIKQTPRYLAVELLTKIEKQGTYSNLGLNQTIQKHNLSKKDVNLLTTLVYGVIQHQLTLEFWLKPFIKNPKKLQPWVKQLLYTALYQMQYLDKIPKRAIFNETIEIAKVKGHAGIRKFVTGILHTIDREGLQDPNAIADPNERMSILTSTPLWLVQELTKEVGVAKMTTILESINQSPTQTVRYNRQLTSLDDLKPALEAEGFTIEESPVTPAALHLNGKFIPSSQAFAAGQIIIQDESAMLAVEAMDLQGDEAVLDACAAPGGKTTQIASYLTTGQVTALDIHKHKVKLIAENAKRGQVADKVVAVNLDARESLTKFGAEKFDKILVDAPCSGIGLMRRKPEVKYEKTLADSQNLHRVQVGILNAVAPTLKKGGCLTYSTCTILAEENQAVIDEFLQQNPDFIQVKTPSLNNLKADRTELGLTIYPDDYLSDGFFIASLQKK
ncbi:16S rRNA (cytosine(967)-C(5))-methyltransferase RsmB [Ligilactobacillus ceti]|uniref:16S rRNA (cytosine(967)-C(5))-methyltransferase n=1 Tax=Ligilactobacillus ceti DSM 22408 TaxID=1122146 RepID=A0A0R2KQB6_9LACO|nr:16S rRNA (cytosine(967)-C(5))-methyltransferase RsmB [Ligilactobacillus ceti]KRN88583.1 16S rRNA m(5)C 967 methyltransferase [Ligilactobacillus ceti DSM 22408]